MLVALSHLSWCLSLLEFPSLSVHLQSNSNKRLVSPAAGWLWLCCPLMVWTAPPGCTWRCKSCKFGLSSPFPFNDVGQVEHEGAESCYIRATSQAMSVCDEASESLQKKLPLSVDSCKGSYCTMICILGWFKHRTEGCSSVWQMWRRFPTVQGLKHSAIVAGNEADQSSFSARIIKTRQRAPLGSSSLPHRLLMHIYCNNNFMRSAE